MEDDSFHLMKNLPTLEAARVPVLRAALETAAEMHLPSEEPARFAL